MDIKVFLVSKVKHSGRNDKFLLHMSTCIVIQQILPSWRLLLRIRPLQFDCLFNVQNL
jgi:hypothetical protein